MANIQTLCPNCNRYYDSSLSVCPYCNGFADDGNDNITICPNCSRQYDSSLNSCPYCGFSTDNDNDNETVCPNCGRSYDNSLGDCPYCKENSSTEPVSFDDDQETTTILFESKNVVGWLVCTAGADKGRDFHLHVDNNFVGRGTGNDINLNDKKVSRQRHFSVVYDAENDTYFIMMGGGTGIVRVNDKPVGDNIPLTKGDKIRVGDTVLVFIPLERSDVQWDWKN